MPGKRKRTDTKSKPRRRSLRLKKRKTQNNNDSNDYDDNSNDNNNNNNLIDDHGTMFTIQTEDGVDWSEWVAATATRNYMLDDGLLDVLANKGSTVSKINKSYEDTFIKTIANHNPDNFVTAIMNQGIKFENNVIRLLTKKLGKRAIHNIGGDVNPRSKQKYQNTIDAMKKGYPVIYQGVLRNYKNKTYGIPDLLVRSDYLGKIVKKVPMPVSHKHISAPSLLQKRKSKRKSKSKGYHYVVIDIKFKTLHLMCDGIHLRNSGPMKAYKSQLCIYNEALGIIQGYTPPASYILGWKWKYTFKNVEHSGDSCFDRLGRIDYENLDHCYAVKTDLAIDWIREVRERGHEWDLSKIPLPRDSLYPNMCNRYDYPYHKIKKKFAEDIDEITLIWNCGPKHRRIAHDQGIYSWKDPKCTPEKLGINGQITSKIVARILEANHTNNNDMIIFPQHIINNHADWKNKSRLEFFVDFETTCSVFTEFDDMPNNTSEALIFTIGVGYIDPITKLWIFKDFTVDRLDKDEEFIICSEFSNYIVELTEEYGLFEPPPLYHWSHAEPTSWKRMMKRHNHHMWIDLNWVDLLKVFRAEPIGIKGCLNYGLKNVAKTFYKNGFIKTVWDSGSKCVDGADAAVGAFRIDKKTKKSGTSFKSDPLAQEIIKYNEVDCKVLYEIIDYLRTHHISPDDPDVEDYEGIMEMEIYIDSDIESKENESILFERSSEDEGSYMNDDHWDNKESEGNKSETENDKPQSESDSDDWESSYSHDNINNNNDNNNNDSESEDGIYVPIEYDRYDLDDQDDDSLYIPDSDYELSEEY
jgi:hypothetical protein